MKHLKEYTRPSNYIGAAWEGFYVGLGQNRDSDCLTRANFQAFLTMLGGESETVIVVREGHWACGWIEWIAIDMKDEKAALQADNLLDRLEDYPILDENLFSQLEDEECQAVWSNCYNLKEKIELCIQAGLSKFTARSEYYPYDLRDYLTN